MIRKTAGGYTVHSESGKKLSKTYKSRAAAVKRLAQIEFFKHKKAKGGGT